MPPLSHLSCNLERVLPPCAQLLSSPWLLGTPLDWTPFLIGREYRIEINHNMIIKPCNFQPFTFIIFQCLNSVLSYSMRSLCMENFGFVVTLFSHKTLDRFFSHQLILFQLDIHLFFCLLNFFSTYNFGLLFLYLYELSFSFYLASLNMTKICSIPLFESWAITSDKLHNVFNWAISKALGPDLLNNICTFSFYHSHSD